MTQPSTSTSTTWADAETLGAVRPPVRAILESAESFGQLTPEEQRQLAQTMVKVASYMANPDGLAAQELSPDGGVLAHAQADAVDATRQRLSRAPGFAGQNFRAGAVREGVDQFRRMVQAVDFPKFVSGLIQNVFQAIVDSSIQQMRAYGELLANVAKTVDQFAQDNITENNARDWLVGRFPGQLEVSTSGTSEGFADAVTGSEQTAAPQLRATGEDQAGFLREASAALQMARPVTDISNPDDERRLVLAARLQIARSRQQLLSSMVILGINRIVVTDGQISAKVIFDMRASDTAQRRATASMYDKREESASVETSASYGGWFTPVSVSTSAEASTDHVATVQSAVDESSESKAEVKARLSGDVRVNFKSDYFPMEKLATPQMIAAIQGNAQPAEPAATRPAQPAGAGAGA